MASFNGLLDLPPQAFELLTEQLSLADICNLRLTSRGFSSRRSRFESYLQSKTISLADEQSLRSFVTLTQPGQVGLSLTHLTIVGERPRRSNESIALLAEAFANIKAHSHNRGLTSLVLTIIQQEISDALHIRDKDWRAAWDCAVQTLRSTADAVARASLAIGQLDLFGSTDLCAVPIDLLGVVQQFELQSLTSLSITLCSRRNQDRNAKNDSVAAHIASLCTSLCRLTHLEIRWFSFKHWQTSPVELRDRDFCNILVNTAALPQLTSVSIRGVFTTSDCLISFLTKHPSISRLSLEEIHLTQGALHPLLAYLDAHGEIELYLDDLWEERLLQFPGTSGERRFYHSGPPTWLRRAPSDIPTPIRYQRMEDIIPASAAEMRWRRKRAMLYGPVSSA